MFQKFFCTAHVFKVFLEKIIKLLNDNFVQQMYLF